MIRGTGITRLGSTASIITTIIIGNIRGEDAYGFALLIVGLGFVFKKYFVFLTFPFLPSLGV